MLFDEDRLGRIADCTWNPGRSVYNSREIDAHEAEHHIVGNVRNIKGDHMRSIEYLGGALELVHLMVAVFTFT